MTAYTVGQRLWRVVDSVITVGGVDLNGGWTRAGQRVAVRWLAYHVEHTTLRGAWIRSGAPDDRIFEERRWVSTHTRYVHAERSDALADAIRRRTYHARKCRERLAEAELRLRHLSQETP